MASRVVQGAFGGTYVLRVSRPGYDVLNTGLPPEQLVIDSRWPEAGNIFLRGSVVISGDGEAVVPYGETFTQPPVVFVYRSTDTANVWKPMAASYEPFGTRNVVYLGNDSFRMRNNDDDARTFVYAACRNLYG